MDDIHPETDTFPNRLRPPPEGFVAEDLDRIPDLPPHTELIDGSLVFRCPQSILHSQTVSSLYEGLHRVAPPDLLVLGEMTVILAPRQRPEPDVCVVRADSLTGMDQTWFPGDAVLLVAEVVMPESEIRDRERKPQLYARAGVPHFWRVEDEAGDTVVYGYELDPAARAYVLTGIHRGRVRTSEPFDIDIAMRIR